MRTLSNKIYLVAILFLALSSSKIMAQEGTVTIEQDDKIGALLELKTDIDLDRFIIQIFSGEIDGAQKARVKYRTKFGKKWSNDVKYETPNYKVWIGKFKSQLAADKALIEIKEEFPNAFVFKPKMKTKAKKKKGSAE